MCLCSKQSSLFSFYALPSSGKSKGMVVHLVQEAMQKADIAENIFCLQTDMYLINVIMLDKTA